MESTRVILAAASLAIGALLLIITFFRLRDKRPASAPTWIFGCLFVVATLFLWIRGNENGQYFRNSVVEVVPKSIPVTKNESGSQSEPVKSGSGVDLTTSAPVVSAAQSERLDKENHGDEIDDRTVKPTQTFQPPERRAMKSPERTNIPQSVEGPQKEWDDRVFAAIDASFEWIENFFDKYASPVTTAHRTTKKHLVDDNIPAFEFPQIRFNDGTAELTEESQVDLKILATRLTTEYPKGVLEIQAYVDSVGPEAFNFVLTQARADAVRDLLIAEGIDESRLIARGYGTGDNPDIADARIEFIVRR